MHTDIDPKRNRCFSDTFITAPVPKSNLYAYINPTRKTVLVDEGHYSRYCCHITRWVYAIAIVEIFALLISIVLTVIDLVEKPSYMDAPLGDFIAAIVASSIGGPAIILLLIGLAQERANFLIPHMICQVTSIIGFVITVIIYGVKAGADHAKWEDAEHGDKDDAKHAKANYDYVVAVIVMCVIGLVAQAGFYAQVSKCYRYLKSKKIRRMHLVRRKATI